MLALFAPPPRYNVAQWAEAKREIARGSSAEPGKWRNSRLPYLTEIMESFTDPLVSETILMMAKQLGKTECLINLILYVIDANPSNLLIKYPSRERGREFSQKKLSPQLKSHAFLRGKIRDPRSRDSGNTILSKTFPGGSLLILGANVPIRGPSCRIIAQDEIDTDKPNTEGDPVDQADGRAENFADAIFVKASTPTLKGQSRIEALYEISDQRQWHVPCPKCAKWQTLRWSNVRWTWPNADGSMRSDPENAAYVCDNDQCKAEWTDFERVRAVMNGRWIAKFPERRRRGYAMSGLYRIMGKKIKAYKSYLHEFVVKFLECGDNESKLEFWTNTFLNETWEPRLSKVDALPIMNRLEKYGPELPKQVLVLTCQVDVQADRLEYEVTGWGLGDESWGIEHGRLMGDPLVRDVWRGLEELLQKSWAHPLLDKLHVVTTVIDSGGVSDKKGFADVVYRFVRPRQPTESGPGVYAIKGASTEDAPLLANRPPKNGVCLKIVGTNLAKKIVHDRLKLEQPGPRYMHFPAGFGFDKEYFEQLGAEAQRTVLNRRKYAKIEWYKLRDRNEALDLKAYSLVAKEILNPDLAVIAAKAKARETEPASVQNIPRPTFARPKLTKPQFFRPRFGK